MLAHGRRITDRVRKHECAILALVNTTATMTKSPNAQLIEDVIHARKISPWWRQNDEGNYDLRVQEPGASGLTQYTVTYDDMREVDPRLPEIVYEMVSHSRERAVSHRRLALTLLSHWARSNHVLEVLPEDGWYNQTRYSNPQPTWYIDSFRHAERFRTNNDLAVITPICYRVETTPSGLEYVIEKVQAQVNRHVAWLEKHFKIGSGTLDVLEALDLKTPQSGIYLQSQYLEKLGIVKPGAAPPEFDLNF